MSLAFSITEWKLRLDKLADEAARGSGSSDIEFTREFSFAVDHDFEILLLKPEVRSFVKELAKEYGYATTPEQDVHEEEGDFDGMCRHGMTPMQCPAGCGED